MDILSLALGFLIGTATGAAGNYIADKYTDVRREKKATKERMKLWRDVEARFPEIIAEMRADFSSSEGRGVRAFFVKESNTLIAFTSEPSFEYHTDKHPNLRAAVLLLAHHGFVSDMSLGKTPMYRVHESLVDQLTRPNNSSKPTLLRGAA
ncbi:hypothetical protein ABE599_27135 [Achromobacter mucicolens]|uniref:hypothetical protein n=1 Tax=Achromobacter mucicolens TaxID=1389922 RepID=UPI003209C716